MCTTVHRRPAYSILLLSALTLMASAEPIPVRHVQGASRGFLALKDTAGHTIGYGDLIQTVRGERVTSRLTFHFRDGSFDEDTTVYSQHGTFKLITDHHIQRGPSFPKPLDAFIDAANSTIVSRSRAQDGTEKVETQHLDMPPDVSNGMALTLIGNLAFATPVTRLAYVSSSTDKSRLVHLAVSPVGLVPFTVAGSTRKAMEFVVRIELGGVAGVVAPLLGKQPDDVHVWIVDGAVPVVLATEGQLYQGGPIWRVELASPTWPSPEKAH